MAEQLIFKKMIAIINEIGPIAKDQVNDFQRYKFRGIDQFLSALHPLLGRHGVFISPKVLNESHELKEVAKAGKEPRIDKHVHLLMEFAFYAEDGSSIIIGPMAAEGIDSSDKATNKAMSAALKYALIQAFSVPTEDIEDADKSSPQIEGKTVLMGTTQKPKGDIEKAIAQCKKLETGKSLESFKEAILARSWTAPEVIELNNNIRSKEDEFRK